MQKLIDSHAAILIEHQGISDSELSSRLIADIGDDFETNSWVNKIIKPIARSLCDISDSCGYSISISDQPYVASINLLDHNATIVSVISLKVNLDPKENETVFSLLKDAKITPLNDDLTAYDLIDYF